jgi:tetratricopeptide (TPR) repeat protein
VERTEKIVEKALEFHTSDEDRRELYEVMATAVGSLGYVPLAEKYVRKALEADPRHDEPVLLRTLMGFLWQQRKYDEYEERARELLVENPTSNAYRTNLVEVKFAKREFDEATRMARELCLEEPENPRWYRLLAMSIIRSGKDDMLDEVLALADRHIESVDGEREFFNGIAYAYASTGDHNEAKAWFLRALGSEPDSEFAGQYLAVGIQELKRGRYDAAERWFRRAQSVVEENPEPLFLLALLDVERGEVQNAMAHFDEAIALLPPSQLFSFMSASLNIFTGDFKAMDELLTPEKASLAAEFQKWEVLYNEPGKIPLGIAWAYLLAGHYKEAIATFEHGLAHELSQRDPAAQKGLGWTYLNQGAYASAVRAFEAGLQIGYGHGDMLRGLGIAKLLQGDAEAAQRYANRALEKDIPHVESWRLLGFALAELGRHAEALEIAERAVAMDSSRTSFELLAWILVDGDLDLERGMEIAKHANELPRSFIDVGKSLPHRACADHSLGLAYLKAGKKDIAQKHLRKAAEIQPNRACIHDHLESAHGVTSGTH